MEHLSQQRWHATVRWQQYRGEITANIIRILAITVFYCCHLYNHVTQVHAAGSDQPHVDELARFHALVTSVTIAWIIISALTLHLLARRYFHPGMALILSNNDPLFLAFVLAIGHGTSSPMVIGFFLIIALGALKQNYFSLLVAVLLSLICYSAIWLFGESELLGQFPALRTMFGHPELITSTTPIYHHSIRLAAMLVAGAISFIIIRNNRLMAQDYSTTMEPKAS